ncbi:hypothetical protein H9Y04_17530 [Streptomyces sp. TRM66268-LWL]|uniref:Uncharacterized protein n=1 Tax=Streptomyces polyasparticus TaxID=2767826 RepID=A0ABR7SG43_9ACTN|nr:hypothetical protein [Streptomyces polyasparticus]MBC9714363.1 hypothetical protein [Streptomyces polyasparticus]
MNVVLALAAFGRTQFQSPSTRSAGLFALDFSEQELGRRAMPVWLFDAEPVQIPPPRRETPEQWADRWFTREFQEPAGREMFRGRRRLAPVLRAVLDLCAASEDLPTVALVYLPEDPLDGPDVLRVLREAADRPVFCVFLTEADGEQLAGLPPRQPGAPRNFTVIRAGDWSSAWARARRTRTTRRAVSQWLRGLPLPDDTVDLSDAPAEPTGTH